MTDLGVEAVDLELVLWGRRAASAVELVLGAVRDDKAFQLLDRGEWIPFERAVSRVFEGGLGQFVTEVAPPGRARPARLLVEIADLLDAKDFDLAKILGTVAHDLVQWDLEDRGDADRLGKTSCDDLAEKARRLAEASLEGVVTEAGAVTPGTHGLRISRSNRNPFPLNGFRGHVSLVGDLSAALPWLVALSLRGGGRHKSFGSGRVRLWWSAGP
jgi:hypothetical protein